MDKKIFKEAQIRDLLQQIFREEITFSRFVQFLNDEATSDEESYTRQEVIDFAAKYARMLVCEKRATFNMFKPIHNWDWIKENL